MNIIDNISSRVRENLNICHAKEMLYSREQISSPRLHIIIHHTRFESTKALDKVNAMPQHIKSQFQWYLKEN